MVRGTWPGKVETGKGREEKITKAKKRVEGEGLELGVLISTEGNKGLK